MQTLSAIPIPGPAESPVRPIASGGEGRIFLDGAAPRGTRAGIDSATQPGVALSEASGGPPLDRDALSSRRSLAMSSTDGRERWFARMMESGLENKVFAPDDVLKHATPDVLASNLPPDLLSKVLAASLAAGAMTPERVLETITPDVMARHLPHDVLWDCIASAAQRAGVSGSGRS
jgi:hypothetical protein